jgi:hypothetical protein
MVHVNATMDGLAAVMDLVRAGLLQIGAGSRHHPTGGLDTPRPIVLRARVTVGASAVLRGSGRAMGTGG